ncbi:GtrA family protein [Thiohalocapsa marina]|uniref:GtrA family protein n=1 Tax=Thiohalocapsa marina TaxID=424902 RepID=UPI0014794247|nr:GtrA family protein [Thiohalocapsa marina]
MNHYRSGFRSIAGDDEPSAPKHQRGRIVHTAAEVWRFAIVGSVGFAVEAVILTVLVRAGDWGLYEARLLSFSLAVSATWALNRRFTFTHRSSANRKREYARYFTVQSVGALLNLGVYSAFLLQWPSLGAWPVLPLAAGSLSAMVFNFLGVRFFAFTGSSVGI